MHIHIGIYTTTTIQETPLLSVHHVQLASNPWALRQSVYLRQRGCQLVCVRLTVSTYVSMSAYVSVYVSMSVSVSVSACGVFVCLCVFAHLLLCVCLLSL